MRNQSGKQQFSENPLTEADFEDRLESQKRNKHAVQKLIYLNTARILEIIGYQATESDSKRLEFAVTKFGGRHGANALAFGRAAS